MGLFYYSSLDNCSYFWMFLRKKKINLHEKAINYWSYNKSMIIFQKGGY